MGQALQGVPESPLAPPADVVTARIDPDTGRIAAPGQADALFEYFAQGTLPDGPGGGATGPEGGSAVLPDDFF